MTEDLMTKLKREKGIAYLELRKISSMLKGLNETRIEVESQWKAAKTNYEKIDYKLAEIDGRLEKVENGKGKQKQPKEKPTINESDLTEEQIMAIAAKLGITLPEVEDEAEVDEETVF